jgi:DNA-binding NarL/FixJ family response regulator
VEMAEAFRLVMAGLIYVPCQVSEMPVVGGMRNSDGQLTPTRELSERQRQVVRLACEGLSNKEIARKLAISDSTVKVHIGAAFRVLGVTSRARAIAAFQRHDEAFAVLPIRRREAALLVNDQAA